MQHTLELSEAAEASLRRMAQRAGRAEGAMLREIAETTLVEESPFVSDGQEPGSKSRASKGGETEALTEEPSIRSTPGVMGGDACIRNTRIPVWMLVAYKQMGLSNETLLEDYPGLGASDLAAAWDFYAAHTDRVDAERRRHEEAD